VSRRQKLTSVTEETWRTCDDPHRLISWSRRKVPKRGQARKILLLGCALVRAWPGGVRSDLGRRVLLAIEEVARSQDQTDHVRLLEDVLLARFSGFQAGPWFSIVSATGRPLLGEDRCWVQVFAWDAARLRRPKSTLPQRLIDMALGTTRREASAETAEEIKQIEQALTRTAAPPHGLFERLIGVLKPKRPSREELCAAILARIPDAPGSVVLSGHWAERKLEQHRRKLRVAETTARLSAAVREVMGNPFRPWSVRPDWLTAHDGAVRRIAEHVERTGNFAELPILGDALEDAGCSDAEALAHCRDGGPHAFGCWVLDAILERCRAAEPTP
jgi:hypothetical protein